jgi:uncharacterized protein YjbI with pentapeptide repeats
MQSLTQLRRVALPLAVLTVLPQPVAQGLPTQVTGQQIRCYYGGGFTPQDRCEVTVTATEIEVHLTEYQDMDDPADERIARRPRREPAPPQTLNFSIPFTEIITLSGQAIEDDADTERAPLSILFVQAADDPTQGSHTSFLQLSATNALAEALTERWEAIAGETQRNALRDRLRAGGAAGDRAAQLQQLLENKTCVRCDLQGVDLSDAKLRNANLMGANLAGANLAGANLAGANLLAANLDNANLTEARLTANLILATLDAANLTEANLEAASLHYASLQDAILTQAELKLATLQGARLENADLTESRLDGANLRQANLSGANLENANMTDYRIYGTDPVLSGLGVANFGLLSVAAGIVSATVPSQTISTDLTEANLTNTNLQNVDLDSAILTNTNFSGANLTNAKLRDRDLAILNFCGATLPDGSQSQQGC